jgi:hypothetical protein
MKKTLVNIGRCPFLPTPEKCREISFSHFPRTPIIGVGEEWGEVEKEGQEVRT